MSTRKSWMAVCAAGVVLGGWALFRPELLFVNKNVNETFPTAQASAAGPVTLAAGKFHSSAHDTKGTATLHRLESGERVLRLTEFETSNGPDVHLYLVAAPDARDNETVQKAGFVDLGSLKGNRGDQNYTLPADVDLNRYRAATVWCKRFGVNFGTAPLQNAGS